MCTTSLAFAWDAVPKVLDDSEELSKSLDTADASRFMALRAGFPDVQDKEVTFGGVSEDSSGEWVSVGSPIIVALTWRGIQLLPVPMPPM